MPLIQIFSNKKKLEYERPPMFTAKERKHFLKLPASLQVKINAFPNLSNRIRIRLMFDYFLATKKFFPPELFQQKDLRFLCTQYGMMPFAFDIENYKGSTYTRHRQLILQHFTFQSYQPRLHNALVRDSIKEQIYSWEDPKYIVGYILEWLEWRRIEHPSYYNLQLILTQSIRERYKKVKKKFGNLITEEQRRALDKLTEKQTEGSNEEYILTTLHKLSPSDSPSQIRPNVEKLEAIQTIFESIQPILNELQLNDNAIRHFGELARNTASGHIIRKEETDRYFNIATFCAYQRCIFEDWMARTFISVCKVATNKAIAREKERLFQGRKKRKKAFEKAIHIAEDKATLLEKIKQLIWMDIPATQKEQALQQLLPNELEEDSSPNNLQQIKVEQQLSGHDDYYKYLAEESQSLQNRASPIIKKLTFNTATSDKSLLAAIKYFREIKKAPLQKRLPLTF